MRIKKMCCVWYSSSSMELIKSGRVCLLWVTSKFTHVCIFSRYKRRSLISPNEFQLQNMKFLSCSVLVNLVGYPFFYNYMYTWDYLRAKNFSEYLLNLKSKVILLMFVTETWMYRAALLCQKHRKGLIVAFFFFTDDQTLATFLAFLLLIVKH